MPDVVDGQRHHIVLKGPEGGVELKWGTGFGGACPEGYQPIAVAKGTLPACHTQKEDGTELWSLAGSTVGNTTFAGEVYTDDATAESRAVVLQVVSTLSFPIRVSLVKLEARLDCHTKMPPNTPCTRRAGVCAFSGSLRGWKLVPAKWRFLVPPTRG